MTAGLSLPQLWGEAGQRSDDFQGPLYPGQDKDGLGEKKKKKGGRGKCLRTRQGKEAEWKFVSSDLHSVFCQANRGWAIKASKMAV